MIDLKTNENGQLCVQSARGLSQDELEVWVRARLGGHDPYFPFRPDIESGRGIFLWLAKQLDPMERLSRDLHTVVEGIASEVAGQELPAPDFFQEAMGLYRQLPDAQATRSLLEAIETARWRSTHWREDRLDTYVLLALSFKRTGLSRELWMSFCDSPRYCEIVLAAIGRLNGPHDQLASLATVVKLFMAHEGEMNLGRVLRGILRRLDYDAVLLTLYGHLGESGEWDYVCEVLEGLDHHPREDIELLVGRPAAVTASDIIADFTKEMTQLLEMSAAPGEMARKGATAQTESEALREYGLVLRQYVPSECQGVVYQRPDTGFLALDVSHAPRPSEPVRLEAAAVGIAAEAIEKREPVVKIDPGQLHDDPWLAKLFPGKELRNALCVPVFWPDDGVAAAPVVGVVANAPAPSGFDARHARILEMVTTVAGLACRRLWSTDTERLAIATALHIVSRHASSQSTHVQRVVSRMGSPQRVEGSRE